MGAGSKRPENWGDTEAEKDYYEENARTIVTIWQPYPEGALRDYAAKQWNGMFSGYYKPRWELFINHLRDDLTEEKVFSEEAFDSQVRQMDFKWTKDKSTYPTTAKGNSVEVAGRLFESYRQEFFNPKI